MKRIYLLMILVLGSYSCQKGPDVNPVPTPQMNVYIAGMEYTVSGSTATSVAQYWKNGTLHTLTNGLTMAQVFSIVVSSNNVYIAGFETNGTTEVAKYWKNGTPISLSDGTRQARALSIAVSGNNVYVAGWENNGIVDVAKYWKMV